MDLKPVGKDFGHCLRNAQVFALTMQIFSSRMRPFATTSVKIGNWLRGSNGLNSVVSFVKGKGKLNLGERPIQQLG